MISVIVMFSDYNLPNVNWINDEYSVGVPHDSREAVSFWSNCCAFNQLFQINSVVNANLVMLDLIFSHEKYVEVKVADQLLFPCDSHYPAITVSIRISNKPNYFEYNTFYYDFKRGDYVALNNFFHSVN